MPEPWFHTGDVTSVFVKNPFLTQGEAGPLQVILVCNVKGKRKVLWIPGGFPVEKGKDKSVFGAFFPLSPPVSVYWRGFFRALLCRAEIDHCSWGLQISQDALARSKHLSWWNILTWSITAPFVYNLITLWTVETGSWELIWYLQVSSCSASEEWSQTLRTVRYWLCLLPSCAPPKHQLHQDKTGFVCDQPASQHVHLPNMHLLAGRAAITLLPQFCCLLQC